MSNRARLGRFRVLAFEAAAALVLLGASLVPAQDGRPLDETQLRATIARALDPDTRRSDPRLLWSTIDASVNVVDAQKVVHPQVPKLQRVGIDETGDLTVVFALSDEGELGAIRAAAQADTLAILRAVYSSLRPARVRTMTVVGTYAVIASNVRARERAVLRAVLSAERANKLDWATARAEQLPELVDEWWLHTAFADRVGRLGS